MKQNHMVCKSAGTIRDRIIVEVVILILVIVVLIIVATSSPYPRGPQRPRWEILLDVVNRVNADYKAKFGSYARTGADMARAGMLAVQRGHSIDDGNERDYNYSYRSDGRSYTCYANPMTNDCGFRSYFTNETGEIRWIENNDATQHKSGGEKWAVLGE